MAEPRDIDFGLALHTPAQHRHRVGVIQHNRFRCVFFNIPANFQHNRHGSHSTEDTGGAAGIPDIDVDTVFHRDFNIMPPDVNPAGKYGYNHTVGAFKGFRPVERRSDGGGIVPFFDNLFDS
jgi:hypothetical protein